MILSPRFRDRASSLYGSLRNRSKEKRDKNNRLRRRGYEIPFTLDQFRTWFLAQFGGENGVRQCRYCSRPIDVYNCTLDHEVPLGRGGSPDLGNLCADVCEPCNQTKGTLTGEEFKDLLAYLRGPFLQKHGNAPVISITSRLEKAVKLAAQVRFSMARKHSAQTAAVPVEEDDF